MSIEETCDGLKDEIATLLALGSNSPADALRFSYELSFQAEYQSKQFDTYMSCVEMDA